jgi:hypothetical protein
MMRQQASNGAAVTAQALVTAYYLFVPACSIRAMNRYSTKTNSIAKVSETINGVKPSQASLAIP